MVGINKAMTPKNLRKDLGTSEFVGANTGKLGKVEPIKNGLPEYHRKVAEELVMSNKYLEKIAEEMEMDEEVDRINGLQGLLMGAGGGAAGAQIGRTLGLALLYGVNRKLPVPRPLPPAFSARDTLLAAGLGGTYGAIRGFEKKV
jgi:hypothetical protein